MSKSIDQIKSQKECEILEIQGGTKILQKLDALGIRPGKKIKRISKNLFHGPIVVEINKTQVAIGFGMAQKIIVDEIS